ncbi:MAG: phospholipase D-like domain-containing protein [Bacteroidia bacterium]
MMKPRPHDFFESITKFENPTLSVFLTYTLSEDVINKLTEVCGAPKLILHDYKQGVTLSDNDGSTLVCLPIKTLKPNDTNCFHSKLALLKNNEGAKFIVGSANLSRDSFITEKEIAFELTLSFDNANDVYVYNQIVAYLEQLQPQLIGDKTIFKTTLEQLIYNNLKVTESTSQFVHNTTDASIYDALNNYLAKHKKGEKASAIKIATPFVSKEYGEQLAKIMEITGSSNVSMYLRNGVQIDEFKNAGFKIWQPINPKSKRNGFHAKLVLIEYGTNESVLYIGSANFTKQGFFNTLNEGANQECGVIVSVPKDELNTWFNTNYWNELSPPELKDYEVTQEDTEQLNTTTYYAWAEKTEQEITTTYVYNPEPLLITKTKNGEEIKGKTDGEIFSTTELKEDSSGKVNFYIDDKKVEVCVSVPTDYTKALNEKSESIFEGFKGINSVNTKELDGAINTRGINMGTTAVKITNYPKLEQYFKNVKLLTENIARKKYFSEYEEKRIETEINSNNDGCTLYLTLQLLKILKQKTNTTNSVKACEKRIDELAKHLGIGKQQLTTFTKRWLI